MAFHNVPPNGFPDLPDVEELEAVIKDVTNLKTSVAGLSEDVSDLNDNKANQITIAPFFNPETAYDVGDLVYYNGLTYRCTNAHEGEWDADDFSGTTIANELDELKSGLTNLTHWINEGTSQSSITVTEGYEQLKLYATNESGGTVWAEMTILGEFLPSAIVLGTMTITRSGSTFTVASNADNLYLKILSLHA